MSMTLLCGFAQLYFTLGMYTPSKKFSNDSLLLKAKSLKTTQLNTEMLTKCLYLQRRGTKICISLKQG